jgi:D-alanine transaminase
VTPVVELDGQKISSGAPGSVVPRLREIYLEESMKTAI